MSLSIFGSLGRTPGVRVMRRLAFLLGLLATVLVTGSSTQASGLPQKVPLLAASAELENTVWGRTVILVTPLPQGAHLGIILNRPTGSKLGQLFPGHAPSQRVVEPVYFGGPMSADAVVALVHAGASPGQQALPVARDVYLAVDAPTIDHVIEKQPEHARFYVGFIVWRANELEEQVAAGIWNVREADPAAVFRKDTQSLWSELSPDEAPDI